jgi:hypothetical protein
MAREMKLPPMPITPEMISSAWKFRSTPLAWSELSTPSSESVKERTSRTARFVTMKRKTRFMGSQGLLWTGTRPGAHLGADAPGAGIVPGS